MSSFKRNSRFIYTLGALSIAAALAACGGGDDTVSTVVTDPVSDTVTTPAVVLLPAAETSTGVTQTGTLNYLVFSPDGSTRVVPADVAYADPIGSLTLKEDAGNLVLETLNAWATVLWPSGYGGLLKINGNAGLICDIADNSGQVGISGNMEQVTDLTLLRGKSFQFNECAGGTVEASDIVTFNEDGSALIDEGTATDFAMSAADVAAYFSEAGWSIDGGTFKGRIFARTTSGEQAQYVIVDITDDSQPDGSRYKSVGLNLEVAR